MEKPRTFVSLLRDHNITPDQFFNVQGITQQVKNNLNRFVKYCRTHQAFTRRMITLALNISYQELEQTNIKNASFAINDILSNQEPEIVQLFFQIDNKSSNQSGDIPQEIDGGIQSQAQRLFNCDDDEQQTQRQQRPIQLKPHEIVTLSFQILKNPQRNQTCLGHLQKIYSYFIRHNPLSVLGLINENVQIRKLLLGNLRYCSVSSLVAQLLTSQDKTNEYTYENLKKQIIEYIINEIFQNIQDQAYFDGVMILIQELINTTKQSYYEYFDDFKRISKLLISKDIMKRFLDILLLKNEKSFRNACKFLQYLFQRINTQENQNNYYNKNQQQDNTNHFQIDLFYQNLTTLIELVTPASAFNNLTKISYLNFLYYMFMINKIKTLNFSVNQDWFIKLIDCFNGEEHSGIFKNKLYQLIVTILSKAPNQDVALFLEKNGNLYERYFKSIKSANYSNTKVYNKNQNSGYDVSIIHQFSKKNQNVLNNATKTIGKDFKKICKKYQTKIATFQNNSNNFVVEQDYSFEKFNLKNLNGNESQNKGGQSNLSTGFSLNFVGKNNISIPILNIPQKNSNDFQDEKEDHRKQPKGYENPRNNEVKQIFQVEEVFNLTQKIQNLNFKDDNSYPSIQATQNKEGENIKKELNLQLTIPQNNIGPAVVEPKAQTVQIQTTKIVQKKPQNPSPKEQKKQSQIVIKQKTKEKQEIKFYIKHLIIFV